MPKRQPKAPEYLAPETAEWWGLVHEEFTLEPHHTRLLTLAAEAYDRCQQARALIDVEGLTVRTADGGSKAHPAVAIERDARTAFARLLRELDLDFEAPSDRRPPALRSNRRDG